MEHENLEEELKKQWDLFSEKEEEIWDKYEGQCVAVYNGNVIGVSSDIDDVRKKVDAKQEYKGLPYVVVELVEHTF